MLFVDTNAMKNTVHCYHKFVNEAWSLGYITKALLPSYPQNLLLIK